MYKFPHKMVKLIFLFIGWFALILGIIGALLPIMPTVPFLIIALWAFSKSSERFHYWLYTHKTYGPLLQNWGKHREIPLWGKIWSIAAMSSSIVIMIFFKLPIWTLIIAALIMASVGAYILSKPTSRNTKKS